MSLSYTDIGEASDIKKGMKGLILSTPDFHLAIYTYVPIYALRRPLSRVVYFTANSSVYYRYIHPTRKQRPDTKIKNVYMHCVHAEHTLADFITVKLPSPCCGRNPEKYDEK